MKTVLKNHFIPHGGNDYKPHILQKIALLAMVVLIALSFTLANLQALFWISSDWMISTILPAVIVAETNQERSVGAAPTLTRNATLDYAAQLKAEHMAANEYFSHYSPDGVSPWYWFGQADYGFVHAGENLAIHFNDSSEVVEAWMDSPTHRANILNDDFREIGIGVAEGSYEGFKTIYVVQLFGTPAATEVAVAPPVPVTPIPNTIVEPSPIVFETETIAEETAVIVDSGGPVLVAGAEDEIITIIETESVVPSAELTIPVITDTNEPAVATKTESAIAEIVIEDESVVAYSELVATSTGGVPASINSAPTETGSNNTPTFAFATQPQFVLQLLYATIGLFVVGSLLLSILIEIRRQHPVQVAYGTGLLATMWALMYIHTAITSGATII